MTFHYRDIETKGSDDDTDPVEVVTKSLETLQTSIDERLKAVETKADERLKKLETKAARPAGDNAAKPDEAIEKKALATFLRSGVHALDEVEKKTLNLASNPQGGFVTAPELEVARQICTVC